MNIVYYIIMIEMMYIQFARKHKFKYRMGKFYECLK